MLDLVEGHTAQQVFGGRHGWRSPAPGNRAPRPGSRGGLRAAPARRFRGARTAVEHGGPVPRSSAAATSSGAAARRTASTCRSGSRARAGGSAGQVGDLQQRGLRFVFRHEAAHTGHAHDAALFVSSRRARFTVMRWARNAELRHQPALGRQPVARAPTAVLMRRTGVLDLLVQRQGGRGRRAGCGRREGLAVRVVWGNATWSNKPYIQLNSAIEQTCSSSSHPGLLGHQW